ncbi:MAG: hypothetical protein OEV36_02420 [Myxococcales bacterium]|nr:hypothetical protein [Myxococcales bacterium]
MDFSDLETNLTLWVGAIATDRAGTVLPVEWGRQPQKIHTSAYILAYLGAISPIGIDWPEYEYDDLTDELVESMHGNRRVILRLSFRNFDQRLGYGARYYAERFRVRCRGTYSKNLLHDYKLSFWDTSELFETDYVWSGRMVNQVEMSVTLGINFFITDEDFTGEYINTVEIEHQSGVTDEYGRQVYTEIGEPVIEEASETIIVTADEAP